MSSPRDHDQDRDGAAAVPDTTPEPYRAVDRDNYGWYKAGDGHGGSQWTTGLINSLGAEYGSYPELAAARGPVRPVLPVTDADEDDLRALFDQAGRKAVTTLAAALEAVFHQLDTEHRRGARDRDGFQYAKRTMMAGRAGSWEASVLIEITWFGNGLNLAKATKTLKHVDDLRAAGPSKRVDKVARDAMAAIIWRWVADPERYTELAETLASVVSRYADERYGAGGWAKVADQWLQPFGMAHADFLTCYRLFYSLSEHFNSNLI